MAEKINIPEAYKLVNKEDMTAEEVLEVRKSTGWGNGGPEEDETAWLENLETSFVAVGARSEVTGELVGMGFIVGNKRHGVLCDFNVRPEHQGKGIGTAILEERLRIADEIGIPYLYTSLAETNPLRHKYEELGFVATNSSFIRTTD